MLEEGGRAAGPAHAAALPSASPEQPLSSARLLRMRTSIKSKKINDCRHLVWAAGLFTGFQPRGKGAARLECGDLWREHPAPRCIGTSDAAVIHERLY